MDPPRPRGRRRGRGSTPCALVAADQGRRPLSVALPGRARGGATRRRRAPCRPARGAQPRGPRRMTGTQAAAHAVLAPDELQRMDAYWRAANYLSVGQIYLLDNALLREPLRIEHVKPRLLGHWGTTPGLNFLYVHMNRAIRARDLEAIFVTGPGHGGPGLVANTYLEGTYTEVYPHVGRDEEGLRRLFRQFSFPGGIPSHVAPETPGSIHEGGELGYALVHAFGAAFDNPDLLVACVVGDGEAETGPLAASWHSNKFLDPTRDGTVLPILHLNGYKIANPTVLARIPHDELRALMEGYGYAPHFVEGDEPAAMHQEMAAVLDGRGALLPELAALAPAGERRMGANPHANGGLLLRSLDLPDFRDYAVDVPEPARTSSEATRVLGRYLRDVMRRNVDRFRVFGPDETASN